MLLKFLRNAAGYIIIFFDWLTRPKPVARDAATQAQVQSAAQGLSLYQFYACPFCIKTRRALHALNVKIDICDIGKDSNHRAALESGGGRIKVPCLRIEEGENVRWMYQSKDIISYLRETVK